eukprot:7449219-Pyramimonas_sp.AAC.1
MISWAHLKNSRLPRWFRLLRGNHRMRGQHMFLRSQLCTRVPPATRGPGASAEPEEITTFPCEKDPALIASMEDETYPR